MLIKYCNTAKEILTIYINTHLKQFHTFPYYYTVYLWQWNINLWNFLHNYHPFKIMSSFNLIARLYGWYHRPSNILVLIPNTTYKYSRNFFQLSSAICLLSYNAIYNITRPTNYTSQETNCNDKISPPSKNCHNTNYIVGISPLKVFTCLGFLI
jgi:hypothetical protein